MKPLIRLIPFTAWYIGIPGLIYTICYFLWVSLSGHEPSEQVAGLLIDILTLLCVVVVFKLYKASTLHQLFPERLRIGKLLSLIPLSLLARVPLVIFIGILIMLFGDTITQTMDQGIEYQWEGVDRSTSVNYIWSICSFVIIGPIHEELFFRGVVYRFLKLSYSVRWSIVISSIFFTLLHFHPGLFPSSFILGLLLAYVYERWHNITYVILLHMLINLHPFLLDAISGMP